MSVTIRELTNVEDVVALEPVVLEFFRIVCGFLKSDFDVHLSPEEPTATMMATPEKFIPPIGRGYVAEDDGSLIGMIFLKPLRDGEFEVKRLYLRHEARGLGLGKRLVRHVIKVATDLGASGLYLDSIPSLSAAISLYEAEGFAHTAPYPGSEIGSNDLLRELGVYMYLPLEPAIGDTES
ncbi:MAG: GNAT family N-acetyltransferase [Paracoccaceae bacterium]